MRPYLLGALLVAACAPRAITQPPATTVRMQPVPGVAVPLARGEARLDVVAITYDAQGRQIPITGATCDARSPYFTADFTPPARLLFPDLGLSSPEIDVTCRSGEAVGRAISRPDWAWSGGYGGVVPSVGISVGTGNYSGVGVGLGWYGGGTGWSTGAPAIRYPALRVALQ
jgi:hypothetical protein